MSTALRGETPDQFRVNFTSAGQLLDEVRDICGPLVSRHRGEARSNVPLNCFACPAMAPGRRQPDFPWSEAPYPLAVASNSMRRCLLAVAAAIIDPRSEGAGDEFGPTEPSAIETFVSFVDEDALNRCVAPPGRWSPALVGRLDDVRRRSKRRLKMIELERDILRIRWAFTSPA